MDAAARLGTDRIGDFRRAAHPVGIFEPMPPVHVDILMILPQGWGVCNSCELLLAQTGSYCAPSERGLEEYPPEWQAEFNRFSDAVFDLASRYGQSLQICILDPRSPEGLLKSIRYGIHRYPAFIIAGGYKIIGWDLPLVERSLQAAGAVPQA